MGERLFVAVLPPPSLVSSLDAFLEPRRDADAGLRWVPAHQWHLTLAFIPAAPAALTDELGGSLAAVAADTGALHLSLAGGGCFPNPDAARVLFLGVTGDTDRLARLSRRCRTAAERLGIEAEGGRFRPHLTVARTRRPLAVRRWLAVLDSFPELSWPVDGIALMHSTLHPGGAEHRVLGRWALAAD